MLPEHSSGFEAAAFVAHSETESTSINTLFTVAEKIDFYGLREPLASYCRDNFSSKEATVADMKQLFHDNHCTLADLMVTALVLAGKVNRCEKTDPFTGEKIVTVAAQEETPKEKKLPNSVENLFQELARLLHLKEMSE